MRREFFPVAGPLDDDLVAGVDQPVRGALAQDWAIKEAELLLHGPIAGGGEAGDPATADDQLVEVGRLLGGEAVETQIVEDEQVRGEEGAKSAVHRVVHPGLVHAPEEVKGGQLGQGRPGRVPFGFGVFAGQPKAEQTPLPNGTLPASPCNKNRCFWYTLSRRRSD